MKVVVGGPPHSGKSTFTAGLIQRIRERQRRRPFNSSFTWMTLDATDNSLAYLVDETGEVSRRNEDLEWNEDVAKTIQAQFGGRDEQLVVADAPGQLTDELDIVLDPADILIILASDEEAPRIDDWQERAIELDLEVGWEITSVLNSGIEPGWDQESGEIQKGTIRSIEREVFNQQGVSGYDDTSARMLRQIATELLKRASKSNDEH